MEANQDTTKGPELSNNDLAYERTILAENRTLMAWIRTAISLISFGFTIYKFFNEISKTTQPHPFLTAREVGMLMIGVGLLTLFWGLMEHRSVMKKLKKSYPGIERSRSVWLAILVLLFGLVLFLGAFFHQ